MMIWAVLMATSQVAAPAWGTPPPLPAFPGDRILTERPSAKAEALGRELAGSGTLASLLPLQIAKETEELVAEHEGLTPAEQTRLRALAAEMGATGRDRLLSVLGHAYAMRLSEADLAAIIAFRRTSAHKALATAEPAVIAATMQAVGELDFKGDVRGAFCKETGKGCAK